jgi:membrane protein implicated in regulation of membrane protease activity
VSWELVAYWICFGTGAAYAAVSALLGGFFGLVHHAGDIGGGGADMGHDYGGGHEAGGHGEAFAAGTEAEPAIAPISPATISVFLTVFGGVGIILTSLAKMNLFLSLPLSAAAGFLVAGLVFVMFYYLFTKVQASSETRMVEVIGLTGEVTVPIPAGGVGEVAYTCRGARLVSSARTEEGAEVPRHTAVRIARQVGSTLYVTPTGSEEPAPRPLAPEDLEAKD